MVEWKIRVDEERLEGVVVVAGGDGVVANGDSGGCGRGWFWWRAGVVEGVGDDVSGRGWCWTGLDGADGRKIDVVDRGAQEEFAGR